MSEPIILNKPDTGKYAKLRGTENIIDYLSCLIEFKQDITILVAAKKGIGVCINDNIANKWKEIGFATEFAANKTASYIAVMKNGTVVVEKIETGKDCSYKEDNYNITSTFPGNAELIKIGIGDLNYAINCDGLNFVVIDTATGNVEDTVCFETNKGNYSCCRLSPDLAIQCSEVSNEEKYGFIVEKLRKELNLIPDKRVIVKYINNLGDFYNLCSTTENTEKEFNIELILIIYCQRDIDIASWFSNKDYFIKIFKLNSYENRLVSVPSYKIELKYDDIFYRWHNKKIITYTSNFGGNNFVKALKRPEPDPIDEQYYIKEFGIVPGKTVCIVPISNAVKPIPVYFWNFCAELFKLIGYTVVFNVPKDKANLYCGQSVFVPIKDSIGFANLCGYVFGMRTGFFDAISSSSARMVIFSTIHYAPIDKVFNIKNDDGRIKTLIFDNGDYLYQTTKPLNFIFDYFKEYFTGLEDMMKIVNKYLPLETKRYKPCNIIEYSYSPLKNMFMKENGETSYFDKDITEYGLEQKGDDLILRLYNIPDNKAHFKIDVVALGDGLGKGKYYYDLPVSTIAFRPNKCGKYYFKVIVTDEEKRKMMEFATEIINYESLPVKTECELINCICSEEYVKGLIGLCDNYVIFITSRDAHTKPKVDDSLKSLDLFKQMGVKTDLKSTYRHSFICIIDSGKVIDEMDSPTSEVFTQYCKDGVDAQIESRGWNCVKSANAPVEITINGTQYAVNKRGLNIVVWDKKSQKVVDSVAIDFFKDGSITRYLPNSVSIYDKLDSANRKLQSELNDKQIEMNNCLSKYKSLETEYVIVTSKLSDLTDKYDAINDNYKKLKENYETLQDDCFNLNENISEKQHIIDKYAKENNQIISNLSATQKELETMKDNAENLAARLSDMEKSLSFRTGRTITYIPRKIRDLFKKK